MEKMELQSRTMPMEALAELLQLQLENGGRATLTVTGSSMLPLFRDRKDSVELIPPAQVQNKGDIILYRRENGQYVLHRVIGCDPQGYICCGDNQAEKESVRHDQLIAVVSGFVRKGKHCSLQDWRYRLYTTFWVEGFWLRGGYIWLRRRLGNLMRRMKKKTTN